MVRLLLDATTNGFESAVHDELVGRRHKLLFFASEHDVPGFMRWPGRKTSFLPVFPDGASVDRAARELAGASTTTRLVGMSGPELIEWAHPTGLGIALGVYPQTGGLRYLAVEPSTIATLRTRLA